MTGRGGEGRGDEEEGEKRKRGRRRKCLLDDVKKTGGNWKLKQEAINWNLSRMHFGRDHGSVVRQTTVKEHYKNNYCQITCSKQS